MRTILIALVAGAALSGPALAGAGWSSKDTNNDGQVSKAEHDTAIGAKFAKLDTDANGQLSMTEGGAMADDADWKAADANGDGQLSKAEFTGKKTAWFAKADTNANGAISKDEMDAAMAMKAEMKPGMKPQ